MWKNPKILAPSHFVGLNNTDKCEINLNYSVKSVLYFQGDGILRYILPESFTTVVPVCDLSNCVLIQLQSKHSAQTFCLPQSFINHCRWSGHSRGDAKWAGTAQSIQFQCWRKHKHVSVGGMWLVTSEHTPDSCLLALARTHGDSHVILKGQVTHKDLKTVGISTNMFCVTDTAQSPKDSVNHDLRKLIKSFENSCGYF